MAELVERVARLEERFDSVTAAIADLRGEFTDFRTEVRSEFTAVRTEMHDEFKAVRAEMHGEFAAVRAEMHGGFAEIRTEMNTQFRWLMGGIGSSALAILVAVLAAVLVR
jgi:chromosome segregation ATPase